MEGTSVTTIDDTFARITLTCAANHEYFIGTKFHEKKEEIWLSPMTKAHTPTEMSKGQSDNTNNATKKFDYTAVADRL